MSKLRAVSYLAPNLFWVYQAITAALGHSLGIDSELIQSAYDPIADPALRDDKVDIAFLCGLPYTLLNRNQPGQFAILGASVMQLARYQNRPIYFADVIVNAATDVEHFSDLRGKTFCYNDLGSNSGYNLLRGWLLEKGLTNGFFGQVIASGSHQNSIRWVAERKADCAVIDSTVLEQELRNKPELGAKLRICQSIGPSPMPPILAATRLGATRIEHMREILMSPDSVLADVLSLAQVRRFAAMSSADYAVLGTVRDTSIEAGFVAI